MFCFVLIIGLLIGLLIGAVILRAACYFAKEDVPELGKAMGIVFVVWVIQVVTNVIINLVMGVPIVQEPGTQPPPEALIAGVLVFLINIPIAMAIYKELIPTSSFGKAALVWLIQVLIVLAIVAIIFGIVLAFMVLGLF